MNNESRVYFLQRADGPIKIGMTKNRLRDRLTVQQSRIGHPLTLLGAMLGDRQIEHDLHERFRSARIAAEWFQPTPDLLAFIADNANDTEESQERLTLRVPADVWRTLRVQAAREDTSASELVNRVLAEYAGRIEGQNKQAR